jgi:tRNA pseudouridine55 synthase
VRSLVADVGDRLGCGAHVVALRRTAIGHLSVGDARTVDAIAVSDLKPVEDVLTHLSRIDVDDSTAERAQAGQRVGADAPAGEVLVVGPQGAVGVFQSGDGFLRPVTVLGR